MGRLNTCRSKIIRILLVYLISVVLLTSCFLKKDGGGDPNVSSSTGWEYNNPDNGGFEVALGAEQRTGPGLVLIEGGRFTMGQIEQDVLYDWNNKPRMFFRKASVMTIPALPGNTHSKAALW